MSYYTRINNAWNFYPCSNPSWSMLIIETPVNNKSDQACTLIANPYLSQYMKTLVLLWDAVTYPWLRYLLLVPTSSYNIPIISCCLQYNTTTGTNLTNLTQILVSNESIQSHWANMIYSTWQCTRLTLLYLMSWSSMAPLYPYLLRLFTAHCSISFMCWGTSCEWVVIFLLLGLCSSLSRKLYFSQIMVVIGTKICETMDYDKFYTSC